MKHIRKQLTLLLLPLLLFTGCTKNPGSSVTTASPSSTPILSVESEIFEYGLYDTKDDVAEFLAMFGHLPDNYMTKEEARSKGWKSGPLHETVEGMCIGGDVFANYEEKLPVEKGRTYYVCDINTLNSDSLGAERIVFSNDGLIYYTGDNYETFELLYEADRPLDAPNVISSDTHPAAEDNLVNESDTYDTKDEVALYLYTFGHLPDNYMTKSEARNQGWQGGALHLVVDGMCIGGDRYSNFEETLPVKSGRKYYECDIDTLYQKERGAKRIVYSNDGLIYYTEDHYETFELLYGEE